MAFLSDRSYLSGRSQSTGRLKEQEYPIDLDPAFYKGAWVVTKSGEMHYSTGQQWFPAAPPRTEIMMPPWATLPEGWFRTGLSMPSPLGDRDLITNQFDFNYVLEKMVGRYRAKLGDMWIDHLQSSQVANDGDLIGYVSDLSPAGNPATQNVSGDRPAWRVNVEGRGYFDFSGTNDSFIVDFEADHSGSFLMATEYGMITGSWGSTLPVVDNAPGSQKIEIGRKLGSHEYYEMLFFDAALSTIELDGLKSNLSTEEGYVVDDFASATDLRSFMSDSEWLIAVHQLDTSSLVNADRLFSNCRNLTTVPTMDFSNVTSAFLLFFDTKVDPIPAIDMPLCKNVVGAWARLPATTFPLIDLSAVEDATQGWTNSAITNWPAIDLPACIEFDYAWRGSALETISPIDLSAGQSFTQAWKDCPLKRLPVMIFGASATDFSMAWEGCPLNTPVPGNSHTVPPNLFDSVSATNFERAFRDCALPQESVDNILVSIATAAVNQNLNNGTLDIDGGTSATPGSAGLSAKSDLEARGWVVNTN